MNINELLKAFFIFLRILVSIVFVIIIFRSTGVYSKAKQAGQQKIIRVAAIVIVIIVVSATAFIVYPAVKSSLSGGMKGTPPTSSPKPTMAPALGKTYYVSKEGDNTDGRSWSTAWDELNQIQWSIIQPGDTIVLDGGSQQMMYTTAMYINKSGVSGLPIVIRRATEPGRNGKVILFGGRTMPLPYCGPANYTDQTSGVIGTGIGVGKNSWITIDGMSWGGIRIYGFQYHGIDFGPASSNDTIRNMEIYDNGYAKQDSDGNWEPDGNGVYVFGRNHTFEQMDVYDNGQDDFQSGGVNNFTIRRSWLHITREDPRQPGLPFNQCSHQDGLQIWGGGVQSGVLIEDSIFGPGLKEGTILGSYTSSGPQAIVNNVTIRNTLFTNKVINIMGYEGVKETGWVIDHTTIFGTPSAAIWLEGSGHTVTNSIFYRGQILLPDGLAVSSGNCQWETDHNTSAIVGQNVDPQFRTDVSGFTTSTPLATIANADFSLKPTSPCLGKGSSITSVAQLSGSSSSKNDGLQPHLPALLQVTCLTLLEQPY